MTKKEKYREFVYEEFYILITRHTIMSNKYHSNLNDFEDYIYIFIKSFEYMYGSGLYDLINWSYSFTLKYYGFLSYEDQLIITKKFFERLYDEVSSYLEKNPYIEGDYDFPYGNWVKDNIENINHINTLM